MRDFVTGLYSQLPTQAEAAWAKFTTHYQERTGYRQYSDFWSTIKSVTLISVTPRDPASVVARLTYVRLDGQSDTEDRWLSMVIENGAMLVYDSDRIGSA